MRLPLPMVPDHVKVYALDDGDDWTIIDTGMDSRRSRAIWQGLLDGPLAAKPVTRVIVTHHHPDHLGLAGWFQSNGTSLLMTRTAWLLARMPVLDKQALPTAEQIAFWRAAGMDADQLAARSQDRPFNFADCVAPLPLGYTRIAAGDVLTIAGRRWQVHVGHRHAPEHAVLFSLDDDLLLGGDQLLPSVSPNNGVCATEPDSDPLDEWIASCHAFQGVACDSHLILPGHKLPYTGPPARLAQMIDSHHSALARLREHLTEGQTAVRCFPALFRRQIGPAEYGLALVKAVAQLNCLRAQGGVTRMDRDGVWYWLARR
jgi:glyoxylase-like metal-dependent hydrolase (beta-lactamase superfamily II)